MVVAIATILVTRAYLELTHYPQVGGKSLHIAHALYGGAAMMLALLIGWMFIGFGVRVFTVVLGGIGFGLFLDEVGKFVTKDNDYFYGPSSEIMYVLVVLLLVFSRIVREFRRPSRDESLANAAAIAADGVAHGLPEHRRDWALRMVARAESDGADPDTVAGIRLLLGTRRRSTSRTHSMRQFVPRLIPAFFTSPRWVPVVGWGLVLISGAESCSGSSSSFWVTCSSIAETSRSTSTGWVSPAASCSSVPASHSPRRCRRCCGCERTVPCGRCALSACPH